jgi:SAM-dependent methyltransferase
LSPIKFAPTPPLKLLRRFVRSIENNGARGAFVHSYQRLFRSLRNHGFSGTWERAFRKAPTSSVPRAPEPVHPFDILHGTDTSGYIASAELHGTSLSSLLITAYYGIAPSVLTQAIVGLPVKPENFSFVDVGCGKGRAVYVAANFPFRHLYGVEISPELCDTARSNIALNRECKGRVTIINHDAATVTFPDGPLIIFMFHPFLAPVLRRVLANLERQLRRKPREVWLLYGRNPRYTKVLKRFPFLKEISETTYPFSAEEAAVDRFKLSHESFTLYSAQLDR